MRVGLWRKLSAEELMLLNCGVGEDSWESLDCKEIQPVYPKGNQSWVFIGRTVVEAETPILWPPHAKSWLIGKDLDAGRDWGQEEKGMTEDEMAGWHHRLSRHESQWTPGSWWWTGRPGVLQFMGLQWVGHEWVTELNRTELNDWSKYFLKFLAFLSSACLWIYFSCVWLFATLWTVAHQAPLPMGFCRQGYWIGLPHALL